jgi:hypothetical protein
MSLTKVLAVGGVALLACAGCATTTLNAGDNGGADAAVQASPARLTDTESGVCAENGGWYESGPGVCEIQSP